MADVTFGPSCTVRHSMTVLLREVAAATVQGMEIKDYNDRKNLRHEAVKDNHVRGYSAQCADIALYTDV
jgi:hypothetical protein